MMSCTILRQIGMVTRIFISEKEKVAKISGSFLQNESEKACLNLFESSIQSLLTFHNFKICVGMEISQVINESQVKKNRYCEIG